MNSIEHISGFTVLICFVIVWFLTMAFFIGYSEAVKERAQMCERFQTVDLLDKTYTCVEKSTPNTGK